MKRLVTKYCDLSQFERKIDDTPKFYSIQPTEYPRVVDVHLYDVDYSYIVSCRCQLSDFRMLRKIKTKLYSFEQIYDRLPF